MACTFCGCQNQIYIHGAWRCRDCDGAQTSIRRRGLTEYERLKLSWYRDERKWIDNIQSRRKIGKETVLVNGHGEVVGRMPDPRDSQ